MNLPKLDDHLDFLKAQVDKLILFLWIASLVFALIHFAHHGDKEAYEWAVRAYDNIQGALLMLLTGRAVQLRMSDKNGNGNGAPATPAQKS